MNKQNVTSKILTAAALLTIISGTAVADPLKEAAYTAELDSCVSALKANIEMDGVKRIRHVVTKMYPDSIGYRMTLQTSTFTADRERHYSASCFANGSNPPFKLRVTEKNI
jgi:hypothetical protein